MHMVLDVGNSDTVVGLFEPGSLTVSVTWRFATDALRTSDELLLLLGGPLEEGGRTIDDVNRFVIGSVVPAATDLLLPALAGVGAGRVLVLEDTRSLPLRLEPDDPPQGMGADRIANALAATHLYARDVLVVDLGTATTFDCVTADGTFLGGVIAPGISAGAEWLATRTAKLPRVAFEPPARVIGRRTETCVQSGAFYSAVDAVDGLVTRILDEWNRPEALIIATGGHAAALAPHSTWLKEVVPHLTLVGLELAGRYLSGSS